MHNRKTPFVDHWVTQIIINPSRIGEFGLDTELLSWKSLTLRSFAIFACYLSLRLSVLKRVVGFTPVFLRTEVTLDCQRLHLLSYNTLLINELLLLRVTWLSWPEKWRRLGSQTNRLGDRFEL